MTDKLVRGVYAAVLTPRFADDSVDERSFTSLIDFLSEQGISGFAINGATGEFCLSTPEHLRTLFATLHRSEHEPKILCGIGSAGVARTVELGRIAQGEGAQAVLLPMPYFFPYQQDDLEHYVHTVAGALNVPILLYNLPSFTTGLETETVLRLLQDVPNVIGIKDSGRSLDTLRALTAQLPEVCRIVGNDGILAEALREGVCDGVVSGVACALPELIRPLFAENPENPAFDTFSQELDGFIQQIEGLPVPWGLKFVVEARGIVQASFAQSASARRLQQGLELAAWFQQWQAKALPSMSATRS